MEYVEPPPPWEAGRQGILNALEAQVPQHTFGQPVPVVVRIEWAEDGEERLETEARVGSPWRRLASDRHTQLGYAW